MNSRRLSWLAVGLALGAGLLILAFRDASRTSSRTTEPPPGAGTADPLGRRATVAVPAASQEPSPGAPAPGITEPVRQALQSAPFRDRKRAILALGKDLGAADCGALMAALLAPMTEADPSVEAAVRNTLLDQLRGQPVLAERWHETLVELATDPRFHVVLRDYALQHMVDWYQEVRPDPAYDGARRAMLDVLWRSMDETSAAISGTALLSLSQLAADDPNVGAERLGQAALELLSRDAMPEGSRISALQVCAQLRIPAALPYARQWAASGDTIALRAGAISALGFLGEPSDLGLLERIGPDAATGALRPAVTAAIKNLTGRNKG